MRFHRADLALPPTGRLRVGLLGGSFDPAHEGHLHISLAALKRLRLDAVWWLVSPGNPLKHAASMSLERRLEIASVLARHPRVHVTGVEAQLHSRYTVDTLRYLKRRAPQTRFVWLMGADNLIGFHRWRNWREIGHLMPFSVLDRPDYRFSALAAPAAHALRGFCVPEREISGLATRNTPAWCLITIPLHAASSTRIRANRAQRL